MLVGVSEPLRTPGASPVTRSPIESGNSLFSSENEERRPSIHTKAVASRVSRDLTVIALPPDQSQFQLPLLLLSPEQAQVDPARDRG